MKQYVMVFILFLIVTISKGQETAEKSDSVLNLRLQETTSLLKQSDSLRNIDSLYKEQLLSEIEKIKTNQSRKKEDLIKKLNELKEVDSTRKAITKKRIKELRGKTQGFEVAPFNETLFTIYTKLGPLKPSERAQAITQKIKRIEDDAFFHPDSLKIFRNETTYDIMYENLIVLSIAENDALWFDKTQEELSTDYLRIIKESIIRYKDENSLKNILIRIGLILLIIAGVFFLIKLINFLYRKIEVFIQPYRKKYLKEVKIKNYQLLDQQRLKRIFHLLLKGMRILTIILVVYFSLPLLFSVFPWTKGIADALLNWVIAPFKKIFLGIWGYVPNFITIFIIFFVTRYVVRLLGFLAKEVETGNLNLRGFYPDWAKSSFNILRFLLYAFMFVVIFPYLPGSDSDIFRGVSVFLGILFSLGSSSAIANMVAGLVITYMRPFKIGDRIRIGDVTGDVIEKTMLVTRLRTIKNEEITVPNASILSGYTTNYTTASNDLGLILHTSVTIGYDVPWRKVHELLLDAALSTKDIMKDKTPFILQTSLDDFYVSYQVNAYTDQPKRMALIYSDLHQNIQDKFNEAGVEILSPHYRGQRDGNMITIPPDYLPKDYQAPTFKVTETNKNK